MYFTIKGIDGCDCVSNGPFETIAEAKKSVEDWELRRGDVAIAKVVLTAETETIYKTTWNEHT